DLEAQISGSLQLLWSDRELGPTVALLARKPEDHLPRSKPPKPTKELQLDRLRANVEDPWHRKSQNRGNALLQTSPMDPLVQMSYASLPPLRGRSEEPGAGKPHAGISEGA